MCQVPKMLLPVTIANLLHQQNPHKRSVSTSAVSRHDSIRASAQQHIRRSMSEKQSSANNTIRYTRPTGPELVSSKHPSCLGLPLAWTSIHDQFIAYMATHAPLDKNGNIPRHEEKKERWKTADIAQELVVRFPRLGGHIKPSVIEKRLILLDQAGDNDYFKMPYSAYAYEEWGRGI
ncbi:uncharacterized protein LY89DRAFT_330822 [Mollisia scopiformis]|uniref:Uncharacterized protein n=1 Tax=Mollisia scopiformis TaxID=149040 RepID=A0A132B7T4_MOLSC|nr:uncharacterized protein LY89DRAFT_330822 [Mollisia scopiformis]KUJ08462.1 hypothetical protein LY89DRAFT_330822 [Mollisia scopiformis]